MKKILLAFLSLVIVMMLVSCLDTGGTNNGNGLDNDENSGNGNNSSGGELTEPEDTPIDEPGDYIWDDNTKIYVVGAGEEFENEQFSGGYELFVMDIYNTIGVYSSAVVDIANDSGTEHNHEIVVGRADREISEIAYDLLEAFDHEYSEGEVRRNDVIVKYLVYSDGQSIALAYTNHEENIAFDALKEYVLYTLGTNKTLKLEEGIVKKGSFSMNTIHQKRDDDIIAAQWVSLEETIVKKMTESLGTDEAREYAAEMIAALKDLYSMYSDDLVAWFAGLYEPYICICDGECQNTRYCGGAGFYYSNGARDNVYTVRDGKEYLLLPDAETTAQAIGGFIRHSGMLNLVNGDFFKAFPDGEPERIVRFIKALQDAESGYFYHPQWLNMPGSWDSRQSRDLNYSISTLSCFGAKPTYPNPNRSEYDGILYDGTNLNLPGSTASLTMPLTMSKVSAVSRVVATGAVHPNLASEDAFKSYLAKYDSSMSYNSYYIGNELASLAEQIIARDEAVGTPENPRPYATILDQWLRKHQDPETGHWHKKVPGEKVYNATNGLLKISALYNTLELPFPNPLPAARCGFDIITDPQPISHVCDLYNTWFIVSNITQNLKKYSDDTELAKQIIDEVRVDAIEAIKVTKEKMITHQKEDGSFSYFRDHSSFTSQNMPVTIDGLNEGDVNATVIFTYGILGYMFDSLDFGSKIQMFTDRDREVFIELIEDRIANSEKRQNEN